MLRHQVRKAAHLHGQLRRGERVWHKLWDKDKALYDSWSNGDLNKELDECTRAHGYGKLESTGEVLKAAGFPRGPMSLSATTVPDDERLCACGFDRAQCGVCGKGWATRETGHSQQRVIDACNSVRGDPHPAASSM